MIKLFKKLKAKDWLLIILAVFIIVLSVYLDLKLPDYMKEITKLIETNANDLKDIWIAGGKMLGCSLGSMVCTIASGYISAYVSSDLSFYTRQDLFNHIVDLDSKTINDISTASLITRTTNDITQIQMVISMGLTMIIKSPILAVWSIIKIVGKSWQLSIITAVAVVIILTTILTIMLLVIPKIKRVQKLTDDVNRVARENLSGMRVVRAFNAVEYEENKFDNINTELVKNQMFNRTVFSFINPIMTIVMSGMSLAIYWLGAYLINEAELFNKIDLFSDVVVFGSYATYVIQAFMFLAMIFMILPNALVSASRINEVLDKPLILNEGNKDLSEDDKKGEIVFDNVSFHFKDGENVVSDISFTVKKGEMVAFIGPTGCGKTTIVNLACRIMDPTVGNVFIDGVNIKDYRFKELYKKIAYIPQKSVLFSNSIKDNIKFGDENNIIDDNDINKAIEISQASEFVSSLNEGIDYKLSEGANNLSGGQKQRLSIARAIAKKSEIIIFDDSFSALDYKTDKELRKQIKEKLNDTTTLVVAQRIGTIKNADKIIVLDEGKIVGMGTHHELLTSCPLYYEIATSQLSKEELEKKDK